MERLGWRSWIPVSVVAVWAARGVDLQHSDLVVQRTLVAVRRAPHSLSGDLVADHAAHHPGLLLDLMAFTPDHPAVLVATGLLLTALVVGLVGALVRQLGGSVTAAAMASVLVMVPVLLPGWVDVLPTAPTSRLAVVPLVLLAFRAAWRGRPEWAGVWGGLAVAVHPAVGAAGLWLVLWSSPRAWRTFWVGVAVSAPIWAPHLLWGEGMAADRSWWAVTRSRWDHHLSLGPPRATATAVGWLGLCLWLTVRGPTAAVRRMARASAVGALTVLGVVVGVHSNVLPPVLARLHPLHMFVPVVLVVLVAVWADPRARRARMATVGLVCLGIHGPLVAWRLPAEPLPDAVVHHLASTDARRPVLLPPARMPGVRLQARRAVVVSLKDGAEVVGSSAMAHRWSTRAADVCGWTALPTGPGPGWERVRRSCDGPRGGDAWRTLARGYQAAAVFLPASESTDGWTVLAVEPDGVWVALPDR